MSRLGSGKGLLIVGIIVAVCSGAALIVTQYWATNADAWYTAEDTLLINQRNDGIIGPDELAEREFKLDQTRDWMKAQIFTARPITTVGIYAGMLLIFIGFIVLATGGSVDEQTRRILLTLAGVMLFVMFITFTGTLQITIT